jgi:hypothetical protein
VSHYNVQAIHHAIVVVVTRVGLNLQHSAVGTQRDPTVLQIIIYKER